MLKYEKRDSAILCITCYTKTEIGEKEKKSRKAKSKIISLRFQISINVYIF